MQKRSDSRVYFDQNGVICQRLGIDQVPARVSAVSGDRFPEGGVYSGRGGREMKRCMWLCVVLLLTATVPAARTLPEGRFVKSDHGYPLEPHLPLSLGSTKRSRGKVPDTANPSMPPQFCPAPPLFLNVSGWLLLPGADGTDGCHPLTGMHG